MIKEMITSKEVGIRLGIKKRHVDMIFKKSQVPTIHRDNLGNKTLMERENFNAIFDLLNQMVKCYSNSSNSKITKKWKKNFILSMFSRRLETYNKERPISHSIDIFDPKDNNKHVLNITVFTNCRYDSFLLIDFNDNQREYKFGNAFVASQSTNNKNHQSHHKSPHMVNGYWRNQPYGSRNNPQYKRIWISDFYKGGKSPSLHST